MQRIGPYEISWRPPQVMQGGWPVRLSPKQFKVLSLLVRARGKLVLKEVFFAKVWHGSFVEDGNLSQTIFLLRRALGKLPDARDFIETVSGKGYRLAAGVLPSNDQAAAKKNPPTIEDRPGAGTVNEAERLHLLINSIEDYAIYMLDCAGRVLTWNRGAEHNKGYRSDEVLGRHYSLFFVPEDIEARVPDRELATASIKSRCSGEGWRLRKNGERFWASFVLTAIRNADGKLLGYATVVSDLSERKRREDALHRMEAMLRRERDRLHAAAESSMDAFYICEAVRGTDGNIDDFVFTYLNSNVEKMVSIPREVLLQGKMCELLPINRTLGLFDAYKQVVLTGKSFVTEIRIQSDNVISEWIRLQAVRLDDGVAITASDITDRKRAENRTPSTNAQRP